MNLTQTTVIQAAHNMAKPLGLSYPQDREEIVEAINLFRNLLYNKYPNFHLFDNAHACLKLCKIPLSCVDVCDCESDFFWGATIPPNFASVTAAWRYNKPVNTYSRWQEVHRGIFSENSVACGVYPTDITSCTFRQQTKTSVLSFYAESEADNGKVVVLSVEDENGSLKKLTLELVGNGVVKTPIRVRKILSVVLPSGRAGDVTISQEDDYELSIYSPQESTPIYETIKVVVPEQCKCDGGSIFIKGAKKFHEVFYDSDIVEVGDKILLDLAATYIRYRKSKDRDEMILSDRALADLYINIDGAIQRHRGNQKRDTIRFSPINRKNNLRPRW